jgi:hypothetical protein
MTFAPAMGIACLQFLTYACWFIAALGLAGAVRHWVAPTGDISVQAMLMVTGVFTIGALGCRWATRKLRRMVGIDD